MEVEANSTVLASKEKERIGNSKGWGDSHAYG
jgi:hypothetical protein